MHARRELQHGWRAADKAAINGDLRACSILAQAYFKTGNPAKAVETEQKALLLLPTGSEKGSSAARKPYEADLAKFQKATHQH